MQYAFIEWNLCVLYLTVSNLFRYEEKQGKTRGSKRGEGDWGERQKGRGMKGEGKEGGRKYGSVTRSFLCQKNE